MEGAFKSILVKRFSGCYGSWLSMCGCEAAAYANAACSDTASKAGVSEPLCRPLVVGYRTDPSQTPFSFSIVYPRCPRGQKRPTNGLINAGDPANDDPLTYFMLRKQKPGF